jgi:hypothetical protein
MGAWGAIIMSFFGALFAALTLAFQFGWTGLTLGLPFVLFAATRLRRFWSSAGRARAFLPRPKRSA